MIREDLPAWRSLLYVPAHQPRFVEKAHTRGADAIILDLEDAVAPADKPAARAALPGAAAQVSRGGADVVVRINRPLELAIADIAAAVMPGVYGLVLTKLMGPEHVRLLVEVIAAREAELGLASRHTRLIGLVEDAAGLSRMEAIAAADPRMVALGVGGEDLATDLGVEPTAEALDLPKRMSVLAARAAGILPLGFIGTVAGFGDLAAWRAMLRRSRAVGFAMASCIHPSQVPIVNEEYGPGEAELDRARRLVAAFEAAGQGALAFEGSMIDKPVVDRARALLARAAQATR